MGRPQVFEPREKTESVWFNPLPQEQTVVVVENGQHVRYRFPSGAETSVPSSLDMAIQQVLCADRECRDTGGYCTKGHPGRVAAGLAPQLVKRNGPTIVLDPALDQQKAARAEAESQLAAAALARKASETAQVVAAAKLAELEEIQTRPEPKPAKK